MNNFRTIVGFVVVVMGMLWIQVHYHVQIAKSDVHPQVTQNSNLAADRAPASAILYKARAE